MNRTLVHEKEFHLHYFFDIGFTGLPVPLFPEFEAQGTLVEGP